MRPARAKALIINAFALAGRFAVFQSVHARRCLGLCAFWAFSPLCLTFDKSSVFFRLADCFAKIQITDLYLVGICSQTISKKYR
ncbi:hypothetical protein [Prevotella sp.]|uniref:hypothetical protein n=1 Tax=Prevotella sp. TaxID=59823 RepID=UPI002A83F95A|nr:hypothetical protein [Prevotella sp.]MDY4644052.1 hypothetical protein [Prevotella sp.]